MSNYITMEKIDMIMSRVSNITYAQAKDALVQANGEVIDAIIMLESSCKFSNATNRAKKVMDDVLPKDSNEIKEIGEQIKELLKRSSVIRIIIEKNNKIIINIPLTVGVIGAAWGPIYTLIGLSAALITKYHIKIQNEEDKTVVDLGELNEEKINMLKKMITNTAKDVKSVVVDNKYDDKDITDELIAEDELIDKN